MVSSFLNRLNAVRSQASLPFAALVPEQLIENAFAETSGNRLARFYTEAVTVWCFLSQVCSSDHSCSEAVKRFNAHRAAQGLRPCSDNTGAYSQARDRLPEAACERLLQQTGADLSNSACEAWLWKKRRVRVVDGTTIKMADTPENQAEYPQTSAEAKGCGFPIMRVVLLFCLCTGAALRAAMGPYAGKQTGELALWKTIADTLEFGDILLGDRMYGGWFAVAALEQRGVDVVVRQHASRTTDFRRGRRLGRGDHLVQWTKTKRPTNMSLEEYDSYPEFIVMREVFVRVPRKGFRTRELIVVTSLTDHVQFDARAIGDLYRRRWEAELNLKSIKMTLQMDQLRRTTPARVRNELRMHLIAYNAIRGVAAEGALAAGIAPHRMSFKGTLQTLTEYLPTLFGAKDIQQWLTSLLHTLAAQAKPERKPRPSPRVRKRRPKSYPLMTKPRSAYGVAA
jgi:hypothetical protein